MENTKFNFYIFQPTIADLTYGKRESELYFCIFVQLFALHDGIEVILFNTLLRKRIENWEETYWPMWYSIANNNGKGGKRLLPPIANYWDRPHTDIFELYLIPLTFLYIRVVQAWIIIFFRNRIPSECLTRTLNFTLTYDLLQFGFVNSVQCLMHSTYNHLW